MKISRKIIDSKRLEISQENVYEGVFAVKLQTYNIQTATLLLR